MRGQGRPDEDTRGGFTSGGWGRGYQDEVSMRFAAEGMSGQGALLFGHRTYDDALAELAGRPQVLGGQWPPGQGRRARPSGPRG